MKHLLLVGAGHAHALVLQHWAAKPLPGVRLTVLSPQALAPYSGMVPGWLAGTYRFEDICIDFRALAAQAGARLLIDELVALDVQRQQVLLASGAQLGWDLLSLNVGSTLLPPAGLAATVLPLRPLGGLRAAWETVLRQQTQQGDSRPLRVTAVGGGAAGFEALLAVLARLRALQPARQIRGRLVTRDSLLPGLAPAAVRAAQAALRRAGVALHTGTDFDALAPANIQTGELLLWATGAQAHAWQRSSGLACSPTGFVEIDTHLRSCSHPAVFAAGDCAAWTPPLPKAGVYAVRMGPVLAANLHAQLRGAALAPYHPQQQTLALLATADGRAIAARGSRALHGFWLGRANGWWKDRIDRAFLARFKRSVASA